MKSTRVLLVVVCTALTLIFLNAHPFAKDQKSADGAPPVSNGHFSPGCLDWPNLQRALDSDRDGYITKEEWDRAFVDHDENGDNRLSEAELQNFFPKMSNEEMGDTGRQAAFERLDKNRDGAIDRSEWPGNNKSFRHMDANRDNVISREEFMAISVRWWNDTFEDLDFDHNNIISRSEWLDSEASFIRLDRDQNGVIEKNEFYTPR
jgi:Ca2+-binding EF-hand superfamily protein